MSTNTTVTDRQTATYERDSELTTPHAVAAAFPGWPVWKDNGRNWWATRTGPPLTDRQIRNGLATTVAADTAGGLRELLAQQEDTTQPPEAQS